MKVPPSKTGNKYIRIAQDYFSKWPFAQAAMPDQKATRTVQILKDDVFSFICLSSIEISFGPRSEFCKSHSCRPMSGLCSKKSHTTSYHPMGDGLVECMNRSVLNLLQSYCDKEDSWEEHLQTLLFIYRTTKHATTGLSPYEILFGSDPPSLQIPVLPSAISLEPADYKTHLQTNFRNIEK